MHKTFRAIYLMSRRQYYIEKHNSSSLEFLVQQKLFIKTLNVR